MRSPVRHLSDPLIPTPSTAVKATVEFILVAVSFQPSLLLVYFVNLRNTQFLPSFREATVFNSPFGGPKEAQRSFLLAISMHSMRLLCLAICFFVYCVASSLAQEKYVNLCSNETYGGIPNPAPAPDASKLPGCLYAWVDVF